MKDFSREQDVTYNDCQNCKFTIGENEECMNCNYHIDCMIENEIAEFEMAHELTLENFYSRLENEEYPL